MATATNLQALRAGQQTAVADTKTPNTIFDFLTKDPKIEKAIAAVATKFLTPDRFLRLAVNAVKKTPLLMQCDPQSVLGAFMTSASLGLEPNTNSQQAFLIPYKRRAQVNGEWVDIYDCQFQVGARGFITLAYRSPYIKKLDAEAIYSGDHFDHMQGSKSFLEYKKTLKDRGELIGAFAHIILDEQAEHATVLTLDDIHKIRSKSETYNALARKLNEATTAKDKQSAEKKLAETPWVMWESDMATKSAIKKGAKQWPISPDDGIAAAVVLDSDDDRVIDMATMTDPDILRSVLKDGVEPQEIQAITQQEANVLPTSFARDTREAVTVEHTTAPVEKEMLKTAPTPTEISMTEKVKARLLKATDLDLLDVEADLIRDLPVEDQSLLNAIYVERRKELAGPKTPRRQMSIE